MHVVICGLGHVGFRVLEEFIKLKENVVVISTVIKKEHQKFLKDNGVKLIIGDARQEDILEGAGITSARAIIALTKDEVINIEISLKAKDINPNISTVVRMYDELLANRIETGFGIKRALSTPAIAAPGYAAAILSDKICQYSRFGMKNLFLFEWTITPRSNLLNNTVDECKKYLDIEPVFVSRKGAESSEIPADNYRFSLEDNVLFFSTNISILTDTTKRLRVKAKEISLTSKIKNKIVQAINKIKHIFRNIPITIKLLITLFSLFLLMSVWVFHKAQNWSLVDSFYFVLATSATVGYGDFNLKDAVTWVKLFGCLVIISGPALIAVLFSIIAEVIVSSKLNEHFGLSKVKLKDHIVVAGLGSLGYRVADALDAIGEKVIAIEKKAESEPLTVIRNRIPIITGDATSVKILNRVGIDKAKALVAVTDSDMVNLAMALHAKEINPSIRTVLRIFDKEFGQRIKHNYGIDSVLCASQLVASTFTAVLIDRDIEKSFWWKGENVIILNKKVNRQSFLRGLRKKEVIHRYKMIPILCKNKHGYKPINNDYKFEEGDDVVLVSKYAVIKDLNS